MKLILKIAETKYLQTFNIPDKEVRKTAGENSLTPKKFDDTGKITKTFYHRKNNCSSFHPLPPKKTNN